MVEKYTKEIFGKQVQELVEIIMNILTGNLRNKALVFQVSVVIVLNFSLILNSPLQTMVWSEPILKFNELNI